MVMKLDVFESRFDKRGGYVGGRPTVALRAAFPVFGDSFTSPSILSISSENRPILGWFEDAWRDIGQAFDDALTWCGEALASAGQWLEGSWESLKVIADIGVTLLHVCAAVCLATGVGAVAAGALEACAIGAQAGIDSVSKAVSTAIELKQMGQAAVKVARAQLDTMTSALEKGASALGITIDTRGVTFETMRAGAARGEELAGYQLCTATLSTVFAKICLVNPIYGRLPIVAVLQSAPLRNALPPAVQVLTLWANIIKLAPSNVAQSVTVAVGKWLAWQTETVENADFRVIAHQFGMVSATSATADFSKLVEGMPSYKQFDPSKAWLASVSDMTPANRTAEIARINKNYPEAESLAAFEALRLSAPSPRLATAKLLASDPSSVNNLYVQLPPPPISAAYTYSSGAGGFSYDAAMKGSNAANLNRADKARWLALLIADNLRQVDSKQRERLSYLAASARGMGAEFSPPVVSGPFTPINADALAKAASKFTQDKGAELRAIASNLKVWASGYETQAQAYAVREEAKRVADKAAHEAGREALAALISAAAKERTESIGSSLPRTRDGVLVDLDAKSVKKGRFQYEGDARKGTKTAVIGIDGACDIGLWTAV